MQEVDVQIRRARGLEDYQACIALQKEAWDFSDMEDFASVPLLLVGNRYGGSVLVAEPARGPIVGFSYALCCRSSDGAPFWWSHMTAVARQHRGLGLGFRLKRAQRSEALDQGIDRILWTFDPLQAMNAHFNVRKLGTLAVKYEENLYGTSSSPLHHGFPTDRLLVQWDLGSPRVVDRMGREAPVILRDFDGLVRILQNVDGAPGAPQLEHTESPLLLEIPMDFPELRGRDPETAARWRDALRVLFPHYFGEGYAVTDFIVIDRPRKQALYVLERGTGREAEIGRQPA